MKQSLSQKISAAIQAGTKPQNVRVVHENCRYTNVSLRDNKPVAWQTHLITGKAKFINL